MLTAVGFISCSFSIAEQPMSSYINLIASIGYNKTFGPHLSFFFISKFILLYACLNVRVPSAYVCVLLLKSTTDWEIGLYLTSYRRFGAIVHWSILLIVPLLLLWSTHALSLSLSLYIRLKYFWACFFRLWATLLPVSLMKSNV